MTKASDTLDSAQQAHYRALRPLLRSEDRGHVQQALELLATLDDPALFSLLGEGIKIGRVRVSRARGDIDGQQVEAPIGIPLRRNVREEHLATVALFLARRMGLLDGAKVLVIRGTWSVRPLEGLPGLTGLHVFGAVADLHGVARLPKLSWLDVSKAPVTTLDGLRELPALKRLVIEDCAALEDTRALADLPGLQEVTVFGCPGVRRLDGLAESKGLRVVDTRHLAQLEDIAFIRSLPKLRELGLTACGVRDWTPLSTAAGLETLILDRSGFSDLSLLTGLKRLSMLALAGCRGLRDLRPLKDLPSVQTLATSDSGVPAAFRGRYEAAALARLRVELDDPDVRLRRVLDALDGGDTEQAFETLARNADLAARCAPLLAASLRAALGG
jgi:hypothetical protein